MTDSTRCEVLRHYGVVALPCRVRDSNRKGGARICWIISPTPPLISSCTLSATEQFCDGAAGPLPPQLIDKSLRVKFSSDR